MMGYALEKQTRLSYAEYQALESAASEQRYEYLDGTAVSMAGGTDVHNQIVGNAAYALRNFYRPRGCRVFTETVKLELLEERRYVYPDVMVTGSDRDKDSHRLKREPVLIIEVLSESTEKKDLKDKVAYYQGIPSLQAYLIVEQTGYWVRVYERDEEGKWLPHRFVDHLSDTLTLRSGWSIPLSELYADTEPSEPS
ncbi:MAG: Uma2 family endonuclease [Ferruginibacter sp.]|nr:Uma2 family endonuclease [Cytophagales bacterium]